MTFEELRSEAKAQGYGLVKLRPHVRFEPCTCGCNTRKHFLKWDGKTVLQALKCCKCGKEAFGIDDEDAKRNWNEMIQKEKEAVIESGNDSRKLESGV